MAHDVFISYSEEDRLTAEAVCAGLESRGIRCWYAARDVQKGQDPAMAKDKAIAEAAILILIFTDSSNDSQMVLREVCSAADGRIPIIPYRISRQQPADNLKYFLGGTHWLDAEDDSSKKDIGRLADECEKQLGRTSGKLKKGRLMIIILILAAALAVAAIAVGLGDKGSDPDKQPEQSAAPSAQYNDMKCRLGQITCSAFLSEYEAALEGTGSIHEPFVLEVLDESGNAGAPDGEVGMVRLTIDENSAVEVSREEMLAHVRAVIVTAFTGDDGDADALAERMMKAYDSSELAVNDVIDNHMVYCNLTEKGGRFTVEPF